MQVAAAVAKAAFEDGVSGLGKAPEDWLAYIQEKMWWPDGRTTLEAGCPVHPGNGLHRRSGGVPAHP
jgi:hypothetical protein